MRKKFLFLVLLDALLVGCSGYDVAHGDYEGTGSLLHEIANNSGYDVKVKFLWQYDEKKDSVLMDVAEGDTIVLPESVGHLAETYVEDFNLAYPDGTFDAYIEFDVLPAKCVSFVGDVDEQNDIRSEKFSEFIDPTDADGFRFKRYTIDSALYKDAAQCP